MNGCGVHLPDDKNLEQLFLKQKNTVFPPIYRERSDKPYPERYKDVKLALEKIHNSIERLAMSSEIDKYINDMDKLHGNLYKEKLESVIIYLNNHGKGHVQKVIETVSDMLRNFSDGDLNPYEMFILLCAIQVHDTGNVFGRTKHEKKIGYNLDKECSKIIQDKFERTLIERIAMAHSGEIFGEQDTIGYLSVESTMYNKKIRERLLAALLRFGDELSDDNTRVDKFALENNLIPENSRIFHYYSQALHSVQVNMNAYNHELELELNYDFTLSVAKIKFNRSGKKKYLLDEIYDRTIKIEKERRYCMRYLRPYLNIARIKVYIKISNEENVMDYQDINYTLEEEGYPDLKISIQNKISGNKIIKLFKSNKAGEVK